MMDKGCFSSSERSSYFPTSMCCRHFGLQRRTRAGCQSLSPETKSTLESANDLTCCCERYHGNAGFFDGLSTSLFAVYQCQNSDNSPNCCAYGIDCPKCRTASSQDIFDYGYVIAFPEWAFQEVPHSI